jgi:transaldolase
LNYRVKNSLNFRHPFKGGELRIPNTHFNFDCKNCNPKPQNTNPESRPKLIFHSQRNHYLCTNKSRKEMKFFIDTANLEQIKEAKDLGILDGVTTNPSLMAKEGIQGTEAIMNHYKAICEIVDGDISAEVLSTTYEEMIKEGDELAAIHPNIVVKIPMIKDGIKALKYFSDKGIRTNCTLIFSPGQALLAAKAGATYVSPFLGRLDDITTDGLNLIQEIRLIFDNYMYETEILAASIRHSMHIIDCAKIGADVITSPLPPILSLLKHPLTDSGLAQFIADSQKLA